MSLTIESTSSDCDDLIPEPKRRTGRITGIVNGGVFLAVIALGIVVYFTPLKTWLSQGEAVKSQLAMFGVAAPLVFIAASALLTALGVPRLLLCSLGGMVFGFAFGLAWTQLGTVLGSYFTFLIVRWRGGNYDLRRFSGLRGFSQSLESRGIISVFMIRQLPLNGFYNTVFLGLTPVSHGDFLMGSLFGFLPLGITACLLGAGLIQGDFVKGVQYVILALVCSVLLGLLLNRLMKAKTASNNDGPA